MHRLALPNPPISRGAAFAGRDPREVLRRRVRVAMARRARHEYWNLAYTGPLAVGMCPCDEGPLLRRGTRRDRAEPKASIGTARTRVAWRRAVTTPEACHGPPLGPSGLSQCDVHGEVENPAGVAQHGSGRRRATRLRTLLSFAGRRNEERRRSLVWRRPYSTWVWWMQRALRVATLLSLLSDGMRSGAAA